MIDYPNNLEKIFDKLKKFSIKPIIIGGYVRDKILNIDSKDIDIELYGVKNFENLENILQEFGRVNSVGKSFGVCKLTLKDLDIDFSLPRSESKISSGHKGFNVLVENHLDFKTATSRRDFTINAIGYDVQERKILDPFNGREDLKLKILKAVDIIKFADDPLRVLRAIQFSSRFNLKIDDMLLMKCRAMINESLLDELPKERVFDEIKKLFFKSTKPSKGFLLLKEMGGFSYFREFALLSQDEFLSTLNSIDHLKRFTINNNKTNITLMLSVLCYYFNERDSKIFLSRLTNEVKLFESVFPLLKHKNISLDEQKTDYDIYLLATKVDIELFLIFQQAIELSKNRKKSKEIYEKASKLGVLNKEAEPLLKGRDLLELGLKPSIKFSQILALAYDAQIKGKFIIYKEAKAWLKKELDLLL
ncbi:CCA tRNA nucleotidyltransferase [Sulfurimonas aquatica]|uniref:CCA tRNA nucleotidyltransferase n=1 Tax=Sulfurimonas aquatica TaxID=2672570 RepID=A0A975AY09_9BACT|nr:CCA tRNA nucleotidyltransferase [Sulfurimonas aquatica]QSZ40570.1 CCA tRNA nucleotidyltransferase [Sulfurimonas aquatica]